MIKNKPIILTTCFIITCTLFTTLVFSKTDKLNKGAKENSSSFWPQVRVQNKTRFTAHVTVVYPGCVNDKFNIAPGATGTGKSKIARAGCLVTKIEVTFDRNSTASVTAIDNYSSSGTGAADFTIAETAQDEQETKFECKVYRTDKDGLQIGVKPGFIIKNLTNIPIEIQFGTKGYSNENTKKTIAVGGTWEINKPSGWYELRISKAYRTKKDPQYLEHQYSGAPDVFSQEKEKPTYEITGLAHLEKKINFDIKKEEDTYVVDQEFCIGKINSIGDKLMKESKKVACGWVPVFIWRTVD